MIVYNEVGKDVLIELQDALMKAYGVKSLALINKLNMIGKYDNMIDVRYAPTESDISNADESVKVNPDKKS